MADYGGAEMRFRENVVVDISLRQGRAGGEARSLKPDPQERSSA
jgi:hypothetical protein